MSVDVHRDTTPLCTGTHKRTSGTLVLCNPGADFKSCGVTIGVAIYNSTDGSHGLVTAVTEDTATCTLSGGTANTWTVGDTYNIYKTAAYNTLISRTYTDKRHGHKVTNRADLDDGLFPEDIDIDEDGDHHVWGAGQPERN